MIDTVQRDLHPRYEIKRLERKTSIREEVTLEAAIQSARLLAQNQQDYMVIHDRFDPRKGRQLRQHQIVDMDFYGVYVAGYF